MGRQPVRLSGECKSEVKARLEGPGLRMTGWSYMLVVTPNPTSPSTVLCFCGRREKFPARGFSSGWDILVF